MGRDKTVPMVNKNTVARIIRQLAADSGRVAISNHALQRMRKRGITRTEVGRCLRNGQQQGEAIVNDHGNWQVEISHRVAGRRVVVQAVLLENGDQRVLVVTTWRIV